MEILLLVVIVAVAAAGLYVAATFDRRTKQNTAPLIDDAVNDISRKIEDLKKQLSEIDGRLEEADSRILSILGKSVAALETIRSMSGQIGARQNQFNRDLGQLEHQVAQIGESLTRHSAPAQQATVPGRLYAERLRFSVVPAPGEAPSPSQAWVRIGVERMVGELPQGPLGGLGNPSTYADRPEHDKGFGVRLGEAVYDYFADKWGDPAFTAATEWWKTNNSFPETAAAEICNRISKVMATIAEKPLEKIGTEIHLPGPEATAAAGIGADLILQPVAQPVGQAAQFLEIVGVAVGVTTGLHPLALASAKILLREEFYRVVARGIVEAAPKVFDGPGQPSPDERPGSASAPQGPAVIREPRGDRASDIGRAPGAPDRSTRWPHGPGITGPDSPEITGPNGPRITGPGST